MDIIKSEWNSYEKLEFQFEGRACVLMCPKTPTADKKWLYKTEYFEAFPNLSFDMLKRGYYVAHMQNKTRLVAPDDTDARVRFCDLLINEFGLNKKCVLVGMSCGGMQAVYFAAKYPQYAAAIYLDAPVMNYLSWPLARGISENDCTEEFLQNKGMTVSEMLNYREHPIDQKEKLLKSGIPIIMVAGDSDKTVPFCENGQLLWDYYKQNNAPIEVIIKKGCDHHPHGFEDNTPLIDFITKHY